MRIAIAQVNSCVGDLDANFRKISSCIKKAKGKRADIIVFPELALTGYPPEDLLLNPDFIKQSEKTLKRIVSHTGGIMVLLGVPCLKKEGLYNACYVIQNKKIKYVYKKSFLPNYSVFDERRYFIPGEDVPVFFNDKVFFSVTICEDIWVKNSPVFQESFCGKAQLIFNISASPFFAKKIALRKNLLEKLARRTRSFLVYCNLVGGQDELVFDGRSLIFSPRGKILFESAAFREDLSFADIRLDKRGSKRVDYAGRFKLVNIPVDSFGGGRKPPIPVARPPEKLTEVQEIYRALVLGTRDYVSKNGFEKVVVGLSGGIDSCLTSTIACDALGKENVVGVSMPSSYSSRESIDDAAQLAKNLGIKLDIISIEKIFKVYRDNFLRHFSEVNDNTLQNIQARIRGNILMAFSNNFGWMVLTTGNKSETSVGYCTLYGDTAGGFGVLKDVPKTLVYKLARFRNNMAKSDLIPARVFTKPPSAELKPGQRDEDDLGPYEKLDKIINLFIEKNMDFNNIVKKGFSAARVKGIISKIDKNEYKRRQSPPGIKITPRSFGKDRRMPITNRFNV